MNIIRLDEDSRRILIAGEITDESTLEIINYFFRLEDASSDEINLVFSSSVGGDWGCGQAMLDTFLNSQNYISTYGLGPNCSTAAILFLVGDSRFLAPNASLMYHHGSVEISDTYQNMAEYSELLKKEMEKDIEFLVSRSNRPSKYWEESLDKKDFYIDANKALELGMINDIKTVNQR